MIALATMEAGAHRRGVAVVLFGSVILGSLLFLPFSGLSIGSISGIDPFITDLGFTTSIITAYLLITQFLLSRNAGVAVLGAGYLFSGLMGIPYALSAAHYGSTGTALGMAPGVLRTIQSAGFLFAILAYVYVETRVHARLPRRLTRFLVGLTLGFDVAVVALAAQLAHGPVLVQGAPGDALLVVLTTVACVLVIRTTRARTIVQLWLSVSLAISALADLYTFVKPGHMVLARLLDISGSALGSALLLLALLVEMNVVYFRLSTLATVDELTRIGNRRSFDDRFPALLRDAARRGDSISLLMIDVDLFKRYNDRHGHLAGDAALTSVASSIRGALARSMDFAARYGGEEFVVVLPNTDRLGASLVAERIRRDVETVKYRRSGRGLVEPITVSVGVVSVKQNDRLEGNALIAAADAALYEAKEKGRNQVVFGTYAPESAEAREASADQVQTPEGFAKNAPATAPMPRSAPITESTPTTRAE